MVWLVGELSPLLLRIGFCTVNLDFFFLFPTSAMANLDITRNACL